MAHDWIDISLPLTGGMVTWPGDPPVTIERFEEIAAGGAANVSRLAMGAHTGTHIDAPVHFIPGAPGVDSMPLEATIGPARVISVEDPVSVKPAELERHAVQPGERLLLRTRSSGRPPNEFTEDFVYISREGAHHLVERGVRTVGIDTLSVGGFRQDAVETHVILLQAGVWIIEGLDLSGVTPGRYELCCLPLRIVGADGAPARAVVRRLGAT
jgi:arylformamidase